MLEGIRQETGAIESSTRLVGERLRALSRPMYSEENRVGAFPELSVTSGGLAKLGCRRRRVQHVIRNLKRQPHCHPVSPERIELGVIRPPRHSAHAYCRFDQTPCFRAMNPLEFVKRESARLSGEVEQLATNHPPGPRGTHELLNNVRAVFFRQAECPRRREREPDRERNHHHTRNRRHMRTEDAMRCRAAAPHVVVIHAWQIVVHKRVRMYNFDGSRQSRRVTAAAHGTVGGKQENGTNTLAGPEQGIPDGLRRDAGSQIRKALADRLDLRADSRSV